MLVVLWLISVWPDQSPQVFKATEGKDAGKRIFSPESLPPSPPPFLPDRQPRLNFLFFGDLMLDRHVRESINGNNGQINFLFSEIFASDPDFFSGYDIIGANLEGAVTDGGLHYPPQNLYDFAFKPEWISQLKEYNFNFFTLANNHLSDQGERGIIETRKNLDNLGFFYVGCKDRQAADCSTGVYEIGGKKIGFAAYSQVYGLIDSDQALAQVEELARNNDLVIVQMHWGKEYEHRFDSVQQALAHKLIDAGADIIVGHHPHYIQGMEVYRQKPIFYSLGNFVFDQYFSLDTQSGLGIGLTRQEKHLEISLFPFRHQNKRLNLLSGQEKENFYQDFIAWSAPLEDGQLEQLKSGKLKLYGEASS